MGPERYFFAMNFFFKIKVDYMVQIFKILIFIILCVEYFSQAAKLSKKIYL